MSDSPATQNGQRDRGAQFESALILKISVAVAMLPKPPAWLLLFLLTLPVVVAAKLSALPQNTSTGECPPCFNCVDAGRECANFGSCNKANGLCFCPEGFGGESCAVPLCGSPARKSGTRPLRNTTSCACDADWSGPNCNVCEQDGVCSSLVPMAAKTTCYKKSLLPVITNFMHCKVTNKGLIDLLGKIGKPTTTVSCDKASSSCSFQFWIDNEESFACSLTECTLESGEGTIYCKNAECSCIPQAVLCGKPGFGSDISMVLKGLVKGPAVVVCEGPGSDPESKTGILSCTFKEKGISPILTGLIGEDLFHLDCITGECMDSSIVPVYVRPNPGTGQLWLLLAIVVPLGAMLVFFASFFMCICIRALFGKRINLDSLPPDQSNQDPTEFDNLLRDYGRGPDNQTTLARQPVTLTFKDVFYTIPGIDVIGPDPGSSGAYVLTSVHGIASPGKVLAIMGASGAGKSSLLDILAARYKHGAVSGEILVNGHKLSRSSMKKIIGYVDQEDVLIPTLTVQEAIMYSALLRLPSDMSLEAKYARVRETMVELDILSLAHRRIGGGHKRGISGGETRRVSIACEMVTAPSILLLDEPTSGLDAFNALNVVEALVKLARDYGQTIAFTIHQPRSNIYTLFDDLLLLGKGCVLYCGKAQQAAAHFADLGYDCPAGFNIADYMMDLSANDSKCPLNVTTSLYADQPGSQSRGTMPNVGIDGLEENVQVGEAEDPGIPRIPSIENGLASQYIASEAYAAVNSRIGLASLPLHNVSAAEGLSAIRGQRKPRFFRQLPVLAERTFKNTFRNPYLILAHYSISMLVALICSAMFYKIPNDIAGFQNRIGGFFFACTLFAFSSLSLMSEFAFERAIFIRERANRYYNPLTYIVCKIIFDIVPVSIGPPVVFGSILYYFAGFRPDLTAFFSFLLVMVLFNMTAASICLVIALTIRNPSVASLISSLYMLFSILFSGLLVNKSSISESLGFTKRLSFFSLAIEALCANEMRDLVIMEVRYGTTIKVPAALILSTMGLDPSSYWRNVYHLSGLLLGLLFFSYIILKVFVHERR